MSRLRRSRPGRPRFAAFGARSSIAEPVLDIVNPAGMSIGADVTVMTHAFLEALAPPGDVVLRIGDGTYIGHFARITALGGVTLGSKVLIADRVYLSDTGHVYEDPDTPIMDQPLRTGRSLEIADGAWIGIGAIVVGNVRVGRNAVVAAGAVVRADVPDRTVVAGDPAIPVRRWDGEAWVRVDPLTAG